MTHRSRPVATACSRLRFLVLTTLGFLILATGPGRAADERPIGLEKRVPWTGSRVVGSPEPPLPYTVERIFTNVVLKSPLYTVAEPGTENLLLVQQGGEADRPSRVLRLRDQQTTDATEPFLEMKGRLIYSVTFHPGYSTNGHLFVFSNGPTTQSARTNRISRFTVARQAPWSCDPASELAVIEWRSEGHDGGESVFGHDGMLYIASGDGTSDSDTWVTGQDLSELNGGVLRIDVDHPTPGRTYAVPADNPFLTTPGARPEIWAYGLRNPWRMTIDRRTGRIWAGNNGQDVWETAHLIRRGENYGWSVYEGNHPFYAKRRLGPTPLVPPTIEHHHSEFRSLTGGVVYYGPVHPELEGVYIYGDYSTGRIWGARHDGERLTWHRELADTTLQIAGFGLSHRGELIIVDHAGGLYRLTRASATESRPPFPTRLSETGLFTSTERHQVAPGLIPYSVNAPGWADGARAERYLALPGDSRIEHAASRGWNFPEGTVIVQTLSMGDRAAQRIETRLLTRQQGQWAGYSYRWNEAQTDATLVPSQGADGEILVAEANRPGSLQARPWRFPSRTECLACHSRAVNFVLGLSDVQMNRDHDYGGIRTNQIRALTLTGLFTNAPAPPADAAPRLVNPYDRTQPLETRARSYLHANCSGCHVEAGGGNARMQLEFTTTAEKMELIGARPQHDTFGIANAMLVAPGEPEQSVITQRLSRRGRGQMPPLVSARVDEEALALFRDWIRSIKSETRVVREWTFQDLEPDLPALASQRHFEAGRDLFRTVGCVQCHRFAGDGGSVGPDLTGVGKRLKPVDLLESIILPSKTIAPEYAATDIETRDGERMTGRVERENDIEIVFRPQASEEPVVLRKSDVRRRGLSSISNMPAGMLNTLEKAQILDLLAYLMADGAPDHAAFR